MWKDRVDANHAERPTHPLNIVRPTPSATEKKQTNPDADDPHERDDYHDEGQMGQGGIHKNLRDVREIGRVQLDIGHGSLSAVVPYLHKGFKRLYLHKGFKRQGFRGRAVIDWPLLTPAANASPGITRVDWFRAGNSSVGLKDQLSAVRGRSGCARSRSLAEESPGQILLIRDLALEPSTPAGDEPTKRGRAQPRYEQTLFLRQRHTPE